MHDHLFDDFLIEIACHTDPADAEFESRLKEHMEQKSAASRTGHTKAVYDIMLLSCKGLIFKYYQPCRVGGGARVRTSDERQRRWADGSGGGDWTARCP